MAELGAIKRKIAELEAKGEVEKAIAELEKAIQEFPNEGSLFNKLGDLYIKVNRQKEALDIYERGAIVFKDETYFSNAIALCKKILRLDKERTELYHLLGGLHKELGQRVEAANYLLEYAERKFKANELEAALNAYNTIKELVPNDAKILQTISAIYAQLGKKEQGAALLKEAKEIETKQKELKETVRISSVAPLVPEVPAEKPAEKIPPVKEEKESSLEEFVSPEVAALLEPKIEGVPEEQVAPKEAQVKETEPREALSEIDKTVELAELYLELGQEDEALECFRSAASEAYKKQQYDQSLKLNKRIAQLRPLDLKSRQHLIELAKIKGDRTMQITAMLDLAEALKRRDARTEAQAIFRKILELDPTNVTAREMITEVAPATDFIDLAEVLRTELEGGKKAEGIQNLTDLISRFRKEVFESIGEGDYRSHYDLGVAYKGMGLYQEAIEEFEISSKDPSLKLKASEMIGSCFLEKGKVDDAVKVLSEALRFTNRPANEYFGIHFLLGHCFEAQNNLSQAIKSYRTAANIDKTVPDLVKKISELKDKLSAELKKKAASAPPRKPIEQKPPPPEEKVLPKKSKVTYL